MTVKNPSPFDGKGYHYPEHVRAYVALGKPGVENFIDVCFRNDYKIERLGLYDWVFVINGVKQSVHGGFEKPDFSKEYSMDLDKFTEDLRKADSSKGPDFRSQILP